MKLIGLLVLIILFSSEILYGSEWLGEYVGGEIPGYEILKSVRVENIQSGGPGTFEPRLDSIVFLCMAKDGVAVVNTRVAIALGEVGFRTREGLAVTIPNGGISIVYGDCVLKARPKSSTVKTPETKTLDPKTPLKR